MTAIPLANDLSGTYGTLVLKNTFYRSFDEVGLLYQKINDLHPTHSRVQVFQETTSNLRKGIDPCVKLFRVSVGNQFFFKDHNARPHRAKLIDEFLERQIGNLLLPPEKMRLFKCPHRDRQMLDRLSQGRDKEIVECKQDV
ncbi:hypothetical protein TNCV_2170461 [Trichonephila clavipes]|nr:hypothetical protein TNCV_2170461 [Trichonephila clavipes]